MAGLMRVGEGVGTGRAMRRVGERESPSQDQSEADGRGSAVGLGWKIFLARVMDRESGGAVKPRPRRLAVLGCLDSKGGGTERDWEIERGNARPRFFPYSFIG